MDFTLYWFMFPVSILIATTAMLTGIGGAALFMPVFILIFPKLGTQYPLASPVAAIAVSLFTETFGFSSGFIGYYRKRLIDFDLSKSFLIISVPAGIIGALLVHNFPPTLIKFAYGMLMIILAYRFLSHSYDMESTTKSGTVPGKVEEELYTGRKRVSSDGKVYQYSYHNARLFPTMMGGFLTGLLSAGIGEMVMPQLVKNARIPLPVAAATSILIVIVTVMSTSFTHIVALIKGGGINAVPWNLVIYTIPGVIIGGQIGPYLQGRFSHKTTLYIITSVFTIVGLAMICKLL